MSWSSNTCLSFTSVRIYVQSRESVPFSVPDTYIRNYEIAYPEYTTIADQYTMGISRFLLYHLGNHWVFSSSPFYGVQRCQNTANRFMHKDDSGLFQVARMLCIFALAQRPIIIRKASKCFRLSDDLNPPRHQHSRPFDQSTIRPFDHWNEICFSS